MEKLIDPCIPKCGENVQNKSCGDMITGMCPHFFDKVAHQAKVEERKELIAWVEKVGILILGSDYGPSYRIPAKDWKELKEEIDAID